MRVAVADDSLLFREGVSRLLDEIGFAVVGQAASGDDLMRQLPAFKPDVVLIDIRMPPTFTNEGITMAHRIGEAFPGLGVVVLSHHLESAFALSLLSEHPHGRGYLLKDRVSDLDAFAAALRRVGNGETVVDAAVVSALVTPQESVLSELTGRETEILTLMAEGLSNGGIGERLFLSPRTVESHIRGIFHKLGLNEDDDQNRRVVAVLKFLQASATRSA
jgi:DNA-binding NarL/FixJ family response regulator